MKERIDENHSWVTDDECDRTKLLQGYNIHMIVLYKKKILKLQAADIWPKYCRYGVKHHISLNTFIGGLFVIKQRAPLVVLRRKIPFFDK